MRNETFKAAILPTGVACLEKLTQCFPGAKTVRFPMLVIAKRPGGRDLRENVIVEFATPNEALFLSELPLELHDAVQLEFSDAAVGTEASIVALQYHDGRKAVAARFDLKLAPEFLKR